MIAILGGRGAMGRLIARELRGARVLDLPWDVRRDPLKARIVVNALPYRLNLHAMRAALRAGAHYVDLGGLFHMTREQLKLDAAFRRAGLTAVLGCGSAPGITNLLVRRAVHAGATDADVEVETWSDDVPGYSLETILDEFTLPAPILERGRLKFVQPGRYVIHSELATLPASFPRLRGLRFAVIFRPGRDREVLRVRSDAGTFSCEVRGEIDLDTALPAAIVARLIGDGRIATRGVLAPETAIPDHDFFTALRRRRFLIC